MSCFKPSVYCLISETAKKIYVGSTCNAERHIKHRCHYKRYLKGSAHYYSAIDVLQHPDCHYFIIEEVDNKDDLLKAEYACLRKICTEPCGYTVVNRYNKK